MLNRRPFARYILAVVAVTVALAWRLAMVRTLHADLPTYITFYPAVMLAALLAGQWAGLVATALSALVVDYWIIPPVGQFSIEKPVDAVGLALFCLMGIFMSLVAERYSRSREQAMAAEKELALQKSKAALAERELQYRTLFTNMSEGFCIIEVIFDAGNRPVDYRFLEVNASFEMQTGLPDAKGKLMRGLAPAHEAHWFEIYGKIALTGEPEHFEHEARALNRWYDVHAYRVGEPEARRVAIIFNDISVHKRAEEALRRQADLLRLSFDAIVFWRLDGGIESWNVGAERLYGFTESEALGRVTHELLRTIHPVPWSRIEAELREKRFWEGEVRHFTKAGREVVVSVRKQLIRGADGVERVLETNRDITGRKQAEEELRKLNRALTALSNSNQAVLHANDESAFLQQVCRIICEDCGHAMVWIGFAENDENRMVRPVAYSGFEEGYLETLRITWAEGERGGGPTGVAIRTGQPSKCRNMLTDPTFLPWRAEAVKRGYASSLAVPLKAEGRVFGAITIYSREPDPFSEGEVNLLTELAADLAYGIDTLRIRAARAQAEQALRESEQQFREMAEGIPQLAWTANPDGWIYWYNQRWYQYTGTTPSQMEGWGWQSVHDPNELPKVMARWKASISTGEVFDMVIPLRGADGVFRPFLTRVMPLRDTDGRVVRWFGTNTDISEQRRIEQALRQSEERWATTLRSIGDAVISTDADGKIMFMNDVAQTLTGWTLADALGKDLQTVFNIVNELTRKKPENPVSMVLRLGRIVGLANHTALVSRDGTEYPIEDSAAPIRNQDGKTTGVVLVFHDVLEKRKAEQALRRSERLATTGRLAATLAHEIHNPLDTVGNLLYLMEHSVDTEAVRQYIELAAQEVARVTQMTRHMLAFQRESSKPVPVDIAEMLDNVVALFDRKIESAGIQVEKQVEFEPKFLGLTGEIRQVLANLFGNALEAVPCHGKIRLRAHASRNWRTGQRGLRIVIADNGPGISDDIRGKIFEPFFTTKGEAGTGLGLWITSGIVENNDGALRLRTVTRAGRSGTCFSVFFPIK